MKKLFAISAAALLFTACGMSGLTTANQIIGAMAQNGNGATQTVTTAANAGGSVLGTLFSNATSGSNLTNILSSVIGLDKMTQQTLLGTWNYSQPGCAFTSESALANAGGEVVAATCKEKLGGYYSKLGFKASNTSFTFAEDGTYSGKLLGKKIAGTYTFDEATQALNLNITVLGVSAYTLNGHVKRNSDGMALLFESKKILTILQTIGAVSGNTSVQSITQLTQNYDGVRIGFDLKR